MHGLRHARPVPAPAARGRAAPRAAAQEPAPRSRSPTATREAAAPPPPRRRSAVPVPRGSATARPDVRRKTKSHPPLAPGDAVAVILAGGAADVSNPLARYTAPAALKLGNTTLVDVPIANCMKGGLNSIYVLTQFNSHELNAHLAKSYPPALFGSRAVQGFVDTLACTQTPASTSWYAGSADATRANLAVILRNARGGPPPRHVLVSSGAALTSLDYGALIDAHVASGADVTLATHSVPRAGAERRGLVRADPATGALLAFAEKPAGAAVDAFAHAAAAATPAAPYEASMGVYVFTTAALTALLGATEDGCPAPTASDDDDGTAPRAVEHFGRDVVPAALRAGLDVRTYHYDGWWKEVASLRDFYETALELADAAAPVAVAAAFVAPPARGAVLPPSRVHASRVADTLLGEGCVVTGATLARCALGNGTHVGRGATLENCVLLGSDALMDGRAWDAAVAAGQAVPGVGPRSTLRGVVVDRNGCVGADVSLTNAARVAEADRCDDLGFVVSDSIIVVPRGAVVPAGTVF